MELTLFGRLKNGRAAKQIHKNNLPDSEAESAKEKIYEYLRNRRNTEQLRVLYVDDDNMAAEKVARLVEKKLGGKAAVTHMAAIYDALRHMEKNPVDVLVADINIPPVEDDDPEGAKKRRELRKNKEDFESGAELLEHALNKYGTHPLATSYLDTDELDKSGLPFVKKRDNEHDAKKIAAHLEKILQNRPEMAQLKIDMGVLDQLGAVKHPDPSGAEKAIYLTKKGRELAERALKTADGDDIVKAKNVLLEAEAMVQGSKGDRRTPDKLAEPFEIPEEDDGIMAGMLKRIRDAIKGKEKK